MKKYLLISRLFAVMLAFVLVSTMANAQKTASVSGNWNNATTWGGASAPAIGDDVIINNGVTVTINVASAQCASIIINGGISGGGITISGSNSLAVTNGVTINASTSNSTVKTIAVGSGSFSCGSLAMADVVSGNTGTDVTLTVSTGGTITVTGDVVMNGSTSENYIDVNNTGKLILGGNISTATGILTPSTTSTVEYNGAAQTVRGATYGNLILSGSGVKTTTGVTVSAKLSIQGTATAGNAITYSSAMLEYKGSSAQTTGAEFPAALTADVIIDNAAGVTLSGAKTLNGNLTLTSGTLTAGTNLSMSTTGTPLITVNGGDLSGTLQGAADYDANYTGNSKTTGGELSGSGLSDVNVNLTAGQTVTLDQNRIPDGNVTVSTGVLDLSTFTLNRSASGGTFTVSNGAFLRIDGTNTVPSNYTMSFGTTSSTVEYYGANQTIGGTTYANLILSGSGNKNFPAARTVNVILSMQGTAVATGTSPTYASAAVLEYAGSAAQTTTSVELPSATAPRTLKINNSNGVTLHAARTLAASLNLTNGVLYTSSLNTLNMADGATTSNASDNSFVDGPLSKTGNDAFTFPVGVSGEGLRTIGISAPSSLTSVFTAQFLKSDPHTLSNTMGAGLVNVSACEYWTLANTGTASNASVILSWSANSCNGASYVGNMNTLRVGRLNAGTWASEGRLSTTGSLTAGTITSGAAVTTFGTFALATSAVDNSLPVMFNDVKAYQKNSGVQIDWTNLTERDLINYVVERSANGVNFSPIDQQAARSNYNDKQSYSSFDASPITGTNYYRIKVYEISGKIILSKVMRVEMAKGSQGFTMYPNPVKGNVISVSMSNNAGLYTLKVSTASGQQVYSKKLSHQGGSMTQTIELPATVKPGVYNIMISGDNYHEAKMFIVQ